MVQRKPLHKLGILADSNNYVHRKPSPQHQAIQDKEETELKKKEIKKSRSIHLLAMENIEPTPTRRPKLRLHKLPTNASCAVVDQPVPSMIKKHDPTPNYIKPTSSSDAKKEQSQVSPHGYQATCPRKSLSPNPGGRNSNRLSASPCTSGRNSHGNSLSPSPSGRNSYHISLSPTPSGRNSYGNSLSPSPSRRNSYSMSPSRPPSVTNSYGNSLSPSPSGRNSHCKRLSLCTSGRNSNRMSLSPCPSGRIPNRKSPSPCPSKTNSHGNSLSPSPSRSNSDHKPCSASGHKPVKTSTKTTSLKPVRTLTKTPSFRGGTELKKQIKKSRSIKLLDLENLESSPMEQTKLGFDESPGNVSSAAVTPHERSLTKTPYLLPNYMKPTSSSGARKEHLQVSTQGSQTSCPSKSPKESNLIHIKPSSASGHKQSKTQMKTSSLKPVRTLLKTSSLRLARPSMKHNSDIALCSGLNAGRATFSSTLEDSKLPTLLTLSPCMSASERMTTMKICPYTYCSLHGHCHTSLPQVKHFLSIRRHLLKTQKSLRLKNLSPLGKKPPGEQEKETDMIRMSYNEYPPAEVVDLAPSAKSLVIKEDDIDFFVEIYAKPREDIAMPVGRSAQDGDYEATIIDTITSPVRHGTEKETENDNGNVHEKPEDLPYSDISLKGNTHHDSNLVAEMDYPTSQHDQFIQLQYADYQSCFISTKTGTKCCSTEKELQGESTANTVLDESSSEADREEGQVVAPLTAGETDLMTRYLPESNSPRPQQELVFKLDDIVNDSQESPTAGLQQKQVHTENVENFNMEYGDHHSKSNAQDESFRPSVRSNVSGEVSDTSNCPNVNSFSTEIASEEPTTIVEDRDRAPETDEPFNSMAYSASVENPPSDEKDEELQPENFLKEQPEPIPITDVADDALLNEQESSFLAFTNNLLGTDFGGDAEGKEQAEDSMEHGDVVEKSSHAEHNIGEEKTMQVEDNMESDATETIHSEDIARSKEDKTIVHKGNNSNHQLLMTYDNLKRTMRSRRPIQDQEEPRKFNPREPKYLEIDPEPEPEKVDLKHQRMDERKNSKEWMCDHVLQQAVSRLAPASKQRVALLVKAFETVSHHPNVKPNYQIPQQILLIPDPFKLVTN